MSRLQGTGEFGGTAWRRFDGVVSADHSCL